MGQVLELAVGVRVGGVSDRYRGGRFLLQPCKFKSSMVFLQESVGKSPTTMICGGVDGVIGEQG